MGDDVDTDQILPARHMPLTDPRETGRHLFEEVMPRFAREVVAGDLIVAGRNFGLGSTRGQSLIALRVLGIGGILAVSFARTFLRGSIGEGIPVLECPGLPGGIVPLSWLRVDFGGGVVEDVKSGMRLSGVPLPGFLLDRVVAGGSIGYLQRLRTD
jgi:3-isopropylmalate/(R)-2-methylmalate dehydratase small subunit